MVASVTIAILFGFFIWTIVYGLECYMNGGTGGLELAAVSLFKDIFFLEGSATRYFVQEYKWKALYVVPFHFIRCFSYFAIPAGLCFVLFETIRIGIQSI